MMYDTGFGAFGFMGLGILFQLIFWGLLFYVIYWVINSSGKLHNKNSLNKDSPKEILKKRLAKGEITKKEFNDLLKEIEK